MFQILLEDVYEDHGTDRWVGDDVGEVTGTHLVRRLVALSHRISRLTRLHYLTFLRNDPACRYEHSVPTRDAPSSMSASYGNAHMRERSSGATHEYGLTKDSYIPGIDGCTSAKLGSHISQ